MAIIEIKTIAFIHTLGTMQKKRNRMTNLLQENKEIESPRTNSTFVFCRHTKNQPKKTKRAIFYPTLGQKRQNKK